MTETLRMRHVVQIPLRRLTGVIEKVAVEPSTRKSDGKTFNYLNALVRVETKDWTEDELNAAEGWDGTLKLSYSANLTKFSDLGRLLTRLGFNIQEEQDFKVSQLKDLRVSFDMVRENNFFQPVIDSVSLAK